MTLTELFLEYERLLEASVKAKCGDRAPTAEEYKEIEYEAQRWLRIQPYDGQHKFKL